MPLAFRAFLLAMTLLAVGRADPAVEARAAVDALRDASGYTWETTARQTAQEYDDFPQATKRLEGQPRIVEVRGRTEADGLTEIVLPPNRRNLEVPVTAYVKSSVEAVAATPLGWMTRQEMRDSARGRETLPFEGRPVRLSRLFAVATRATNVEAPADELRGLLADIATYEADGDEIVGHLHPGAAAMLRDGSRRSGNTDGLAGRVVFRIREGELREYEVRLETEVPRSGRSPIRRIERWTTTLSAIGATEVHPPPAVARKLAAEE